MAKTVCTTCGAQFDDASGVCPGCGSGSGRGKALLECADGFRSLSQALEKANFPEEVEACNALIKDMRELVIRENANAPFAVGVIGEFSAGKSSFINSLIGRDICPVGDEATTSAVTVFRHRKLAETRFFQTDADGKAAAPISEEEYGRLARHGSGREDAFYFACTLKAPDLDGIALYDTPGFNNANSAKGRRDTELTEKVLGRMDAIFYVADINAGSLGNYGLERLRPFKERGIPVYLILNKEDTKAPGKREAILAQCREEFDGFAGAVNYSSTEERLLRASDKRDALWGWLADLGRTRPDPFASSLGQLRQRCGAFLDGLSRPRMDAAAWRRETLTALGRAIRKTLENWWIPRETETHELMVSLRQGTNDAVDAAITDCLDASERVYLRQTFPHEWTPEIQAFFGQAIGAAKVAWRERRGYREEGGGTIKEIIEMWNKPFGVAAAMRVTTYANVAEALAGAEAFFAAITAEDNLAPCCEEIFRLPEIVAAAVQANPERTRVREAIANARACLERV